MDKQTKIQKKIEKCLRDLKFSKVIPAKSQLAIQKYKENSKRELTKKFSMVNFKVPDPRNQMIDQMYKSCDRVLNDPNLLLDAKSIKRSQEEIRTKLGYSSLNRIVSYSPKVEEEEELRKSHVMFEAASHSQFNRSPVLKFKIFNSLKDTVSQENFVKLFHKS